jgi:CheY-like chemotaxis protein
MKGNKILIVDDEPTIRLTLRKMLRDDHAVVEAGNGEEALVAAVTHKPNLIIMDLLMPGIDGYTACYNLKENPETKDIPVIMLTAVDHDLNRKLAEKMGADGYMTKPIDKKDLLQTVEKYLKK